jgi:hypothetical protein
VRSIRAVSLNSECSLRFANPTVSQASLRLCLPPPRSTDDVLIAANFSDSDRRYADPLLPVRGDHLLSSAVAGGDEIERRPLHLRPKQPPYGLS